MSVWAGVSKSSRALKRSISISGPARDQAYVYGSVSATTRDVLKATAQEEGRVVLLYDLEWLVCRCVVEGVEAEQGGAMRESESVFSILDVVIAAVIERQTRGRRCKARAEGGEGGCREPCWVLPVPAGNEGRSRKGSMREGEAVRRSGYGRTGSVLSSFEAA